MVGGTIWVESRLRVHPLVWIGLGLLAAATAGLAGWWQALPFLTSQVVGFRLPLLGEVFRYSGTFVYRIVPERDTVPVVSPALPTLSMWLTQNSPN